MTRHHRDIRFALALALATAAMPAEAHAPGIGIVVAVLPMLFRPLLCVLSKEPRLTLLSTWSDLPSSRRNQCSAT